MKFIVLVEESGYQVRYWDEINNEIGECIAESWNSSKLFKALKARGFNIKKTELEEAISLIDKDPFVILSSKQKDPLDLDTLINSSFTIEKNGE